MSRVDLIIFLLFVFTNSSRVSYPRRTVFRHFCISWNTVCQYGHYICPFLIAIQQSRTFIILSCTWAFLCLYIAVCTLSCWHFWILTLYVFFVCVLSFYLTFVFWNFCSSLIIYLLNINWFSTTTNQLPNLFSHSLFSTLSFLFAFLFCLALKIHNKGHGHIVCP